MELVTVNLHPSLQKFNMGKSQFSVSTCDVKSLPFRILDRCPSLKPFLLDRNGHLSGYINIYVNEKDWRQIDKEERIKPSDRIEILTSLVGG